MILCLALGFLAYGVWGWSSAPLIGLAAGVVIGNLVPRSKGGWACGTDWMQSAQDDARATAQKTPPTGVGPAIPTDPRGMSTGEMRRERVES